MSKLKAVIFASIVASTVTLFVSVPFFIFGNKSFAIGVAAASSLISLYHMYVAIIESGRK
jgi:hypothetical protein